MSYNNLVYGLARHETFIAQWLEHPTGVRKVIGSIPVGDSDLFFVPCSRHVDFFTELKTYLFFLIYHKCSYCFETLKQWLLLLITVVKVLLNLPQSLLVAFRP